MKTLTLFLMLTSCLRLSAQNISSFPEDLIITPERSNFEKTSTYSDVINFLNALKERSSYIRVTTIGKSPMGKDIPLAILSKNAISTPAEAKASGMPVMYIQGNIHAGEVEGKEVCMMLMRDIVLGKKKNLLNNIIIIMVPIYNIDGNDKMAKGLRPTQENSPLETGERENGQGLDLNRDAIKMEAPETQALMQNVINAWDPQLSMDLHTTNGTWHAYSLTWAPSYLYAGEPAPYYYTNDILLPAITQKLKEEYGLFIGPYGDYNLREGWPLKNFYTYNHHPRYVINQFGLRNRMAILSESFAHERFYQRIYSTYTFVDEILNYFNKHRDEIVQINRASEQQAIKNIVENAGKVKKGVRFKMVPSKQLNGFRTYDYVNFTKADGNKTLLKTGNVVRYDSITYYGEFKDTVQSTLPRGYIIPAAFSNIVEKLIQQGIKVDTLASNISLSGEVFTIEKFNRAPRKFEGHFMASAEGSFSAANKIANKGDFKVDMAQPLTNLIFYLLEPQSDDGLLTWNFFDHYLDQQGVGSMAIEYPVFKYFAWPTEPEKAAGRKKK